MPTKPSYKEILLTQGQVAIVDAADFDWLNQWKWSARWNKGTQSFYALRNIPAPNGRQVTLGMHRAILGLQNGDKRYADHRNHETLDNRRENLRIATGAQNQQNGRKRKDNGSGFKGVRICRNGFYQATIRINGKETYLGRSKNPAAAHALYRAAALEFFGEFACFGYQDERPV